MGNALKKREEKLKVRQDDFDTTKLGMKKGFKRPGSMNTHKQRPGGSTGGKRR